MSSYDYITIFDTVEDHVKDGIFTYIKSNIGTVPDWLQDSDNLNMGYYFYHSGNKITSPLVDRLLTDGLLTSDNSNKISNIILAAYKDNWAKLYKALTIDYSPIENVDETLTETTETTGNKQTTDNNTRTGTDNHAKKGDNTLAMTGTDTTAHTGTDTTEHTGTDKTVTDTDNNNYHHEYLTDSSKKPTTTETTNGIAGFNSDEFSKDTKSTTTSNEEITTVHRTVSVQTDKDGNPIHDDDGNEIKEPGKNSDQFEGKETVSETINTKDAETINTKDTQTLDRTDTTNYNESDDETINITDSGNGTEDTTGNETHNLHRHGNVGVTTNQHMINEEIELRKHYFLEYVYADVDRFMAIPIY